MNRTRTWNVALPYIGPFDNFEGFAATVEPECWEHFVITDNSAKSDLKRLALESKGARVTYCHGNDGIARAWNRGLREDKDLTIIISTSMRFPVGFREVAETMICHTSDYGVLTQHGWHCIGIGWRCVLNIGFIDENYFPGYFEDIDYAYRQKRGGMHEDGKHLPRCEPPMTCIGDAVALKAGLVQVNLLAQAEYLEKKWGSKGPPVVYMTPFNDPKNDLKYWPEPPKRNL